MSELFQCARRQIYYVNEVDTIFFKAHKTNYCFSKGIVSHIPKKTVLVRVGLARV